MKILFVITGLGMGGAEKVVTALADEMSALGNKVKIAYLKEPVLVQPQNRSIDLVYLGLEKPLDFLCASKVYKTLLSDFRPDVVHSHMVHANIFTRVNRCFFSVPKLICTAHNSNEGGYLRMLAYRLTHRASDITTNVSNDATKAFEQKKAVPKGDMLTVYNGICLDKFNYINQNNLSKYKAEFRINTQRVVLAVGRFNEQKDYPNLIKAIHLLDKDKSSDFVLLVAGEGCLKDEIQSLINSYGLSDKIKLLGNRNDIAELMNFAEIFILSSKHEGLPTVLIEAMACHMTVVSTDCGGSSEILGETGFLVPPENCNALFEGLKQALSMSQQEVIQNGNAARKRVEDLFSLESSVAKWLNIYGF